MSFDERTIKSVDNRIDELLRTEYSNLKFKPGQARVPAGSSRGGEFTSAGSTAGGGGSLVESGYTYDGDKLGTTIKFKEDQAYKLAISNPTNGFAMRTGVGQKDGTISIDTMLGSTKQQLSGNLPTFSNKDRVLVTTIKNEDRRNPKGGPLRKPPKPRKSLEEELEERMKNPDAHR